MIYFCFHAVVFLSFQSPDSGLANVRSTSCLIRVCRIAGLSVTTTSKVNLLSRCLGYVTVSRRLETYVADASGDAGHGPQGHEVSHAAVSSAVR